MKSPIVRTIELWRDAGKYQQAAELAVATFPGEHNADRRFDIVDAICAAALEARDLASAQDICERYPGDVSLETIWGVEQFLDEVEIIEVPDPALFIAALDKRAG